MNPQTSARDTLAALAPRNHYYRRAFRRFERLSPDQQSTIQVGFNRHIRACVKTGVDPDPMWVAECVDDAAGGYR